MSRTEPSTPAAPTPAAQAPFRIEPIADGAIFRLTRPHKLNAITLPILQGLSELIDSLPARGGRLLIVTGEGERSFCAGTDLNEARDQAVDGFESKSAMARDLFWRLSRSTLISVAAVNGLAFGGGLELAMACTFRVAASHARASLPEIKLGLLPAYGGTQFLPALVGRGRALDLMLSGRALEADEALAIGLYDRIAEAGTPLLEQAIAFGRSITRYSGVAIDAIRACVDSAGPGVTEEGLRIEDRQVRIVAASEDAREGVAAFLEKRAPVFLHR